MNAKTDGMKSLALIAWAGLMTAMTYILGAAPLHALYKMTGRFGYWFLTAGFSLIFAGLGYYVMAAWFFVIALTIGIYNELKSHGASIMKSGFFSIMASFSMLAGLSFYWAQKTQDWFSVLEHEVMDVVAKAFMLNAEAATSFKPQEIIFQIPSIVFMALSVSVFIAVIFEKRLLLWLKKPVLRRERLSNFRLPDVLVWIFIFSLLGAFIKTDVEAINWVSRNVLNITMLFYFFQGLAIVVRYFETFRVGYIWRILWLLILVLQLSFMLSFIGVLDFWFDFRKKLDRRLVEKTENGNES